MDDKAEMGGKIEVERFPVTDGRILGSCTGELVSVRSMLTTAELALIPAPTPAPAPAVAGAHGSMSTDGYR
jgi:hypothetical protein